MPPGLRPAKISQPLLRPAANRRRAPTRKPSASVHQYEAMKILSPQVSARDHPLLFDRNDSFRSAFLDRRQFLLEPSQFVPPRPQRNLTADCIRQSSKQVLHKPMLAQPSSADLRSAKAE